MFNSTTTKRTIAAMAGITLLLCSQAFAGNGNGKGKGASDEAQLRISSRVKDKKAKGKDDDLLQVIVTYHERPDAADEDSVARGNGQLKRKFSLIDGHVVTIKSKHLERLMDNPKVKRMVLDEPMMTAGSTAKAIENEEAIVSIQATPSGVSTPGYSYATPPIFGMSSIDNLHSSGIHGDGIGVAVIDSGFISHKDTKPVKTLSFINYDNDARDWYGHGNHVIGIIGGNGHSARGGELDGYESEDIPKYAYRGIAPKARIFSLRVMDNKGRGYTSDVIAALEWVRDNAAAEGIHLVNLSLGHPVYEPAEHDPLVQAVEQVWDAGIVVVASAGNAGRDGYGTITSPGNSRKIITVGSITHWGDTDASNDIVSTFSSRGVTLFDNVAKPDLVAPGNRMIAIDADNSEMFTKESERRITAPKKRKADYLQLSGTSMSAAVVSGAVALMLDDDPSLNPATVKARLMRSATKVDFPDVFAIGAGVLDIHGAINEQGYVNSALSPRVVRNTDTLEMGVEDTGVLWGGLEWSLGFLWNDGYLWNDGFLWNDSRAVDE